MLLQRTLFPSGLVPTQAEHPLCSGKASGGAGQELQAAVRSRGLCCSLGNHTQANSLMNSGSLHKSCWEVQSVPAAPEPLSALFAGEAAVPHRSPSPPRAPRGLITLLLEGRLKGYLLFPLGL